MPIGKAGKLRGALFTPRLPQQIPLVQTHSEKAMQADNYQKNLFKS
jgi:hypothetical protein